MGLKKALATKSQIYKNIYIYITQFTFTDMECNQIFSWVLKTVNEELLGADSAFVIFTVTYNNLPDRYISSIYLLIIFLKPVGIPSNVQRRGTRFEYTNETNIVHL